MRFLVVAVIAAACGDNQHGEGVPLVAAHDLTVIAHQDDDLLFMQPDLIEAARSGNGITNVYVTAGNGMKGAAAANPRYTGLMRAYGHAVDDQNWSCGWIEILGHEVQHCRLEAENISLVFLAYPDGGIEGQFPNSLLSMWQGKTLSATTIADRTTTYTREQLIDTVAEIEREVHPAVVRTLDLSAGHGRDHTDHLIVGALTAMALARTTDEPELIAHRGYDNAGEPANKLGKLFDEALDVLSYYEACTARCGVDCGQPCPDVETAHQVWLGRRYAFGFRKTASGQLRANDRCLAGGVLTDCATAPQFTLVHGQLHAAGGCLAIGESSVTIAPCTADLSQRLFSDDEGHLWSAVPPLPGSDPKYLRCVIPNADGTVSSGACGGPDAPRWQWPRRSRRHRVRRSVSRRPGAACGSAMSPATASVICVRSPPRV